MIPSVDQLVEATRASPFSAQRLHRHVHIPKDVVPALLQCGADAPSGVALAAHALGELRHPMAGEITPFARAMFWETQFNAFSLLS
jgi:hypothetical protein